MIGLNLLKWVLTSSLNNLTFNTIRLRKQHRVDYTSVVQIPESQYVWRFSLCGECFFINNFHLCSCYLALSLFLLLSLLIFRSYLLHAFSFRLQKKKQYYTCAKCFRACERKKDFVIQILQ